MCVYWNKEDHKSIQCKAVTDTNKWRKILIEEKLCFNYTVGKHRASEHKSEQTCRICNGKHHTSKCDKDKGLLLTSNKTWASVKYLVVLIKVCGITYRALLDTVSGSPYVSASLEDKLT